MAATAREANLGSPALSNQACPILVFDEGPSEEWVLAQMENDPVGTVAGRAVGDIYIHGKKCPACMGYEVSENNKWMYDQSALLGLRGENAAGLKAPVIYRPQSGSSAHGMLEPEDLVHPEDVLSIPNVSKDDLWVPDRNERQGAYWLSEEENHTHSVG
jgi:hypothetical protein